MDLSARIQRQHYWVAVKPIVCKDGFSMSVQAGEYLYCTPRTAKGPWTHVEVGFPLITEPALLPYIDDERDDPTDAVYPNVPIEVVEQIILSHGGMKE